MFSPIVFRFFPAIPLPRAEKRYEFAALRGTIRLLTTWGYAGYRIGEDRSGGYEGYFKTARTKTADFRVGSKTAAAPISRESCANSNRSEQTPPGDPNWKQ
jgi:hypothetical protein